MNKTSFEKGYEDGFEIGIAIGPRPIGCETIEDLFGLLPPEMVLRLQQWPAERKRMLLKAIAKAVSLRDIDLDS